MKKLLEQKGVQIFIGFMISQAILKGIFAKSRQKQKEEEKALLKRTEDIFAESLEETFKIPEFETVEFEPMDYTKFKNNQD